jgi:hypothetical protein
VVGSLKHPNEHFNSVKGMKFPDQLIDYELLKEDCFVELSICLVKLLQQNSGSLLGSLCPGVCKSYGGHCQGIWTGVDWSRGWIMFGPEWAKESNYLRSFSLNPHIKLRVNSRHYPMIWIQIFEKWYLFLTLRKYCSMSAKSQNCEASRDSRC